MPKHCFQRANTAARRSEPDMPPKDVRTSSFLGGWEPAVPPVGGIDAERHDARAGAALTDEQSQDRPAGERLLARSVPAQPWHRSLSSSLVWQEVGGTAQAALCPAGLEDASPIDDGDVHVQEVVSWCFLLLVRIA